MLTFLMDMEKNDVDKKLMRDRTIGITGLRTDNTTIWFLVILFISSYLWQYVIFLTGGVESKLFPFVMFFPAIAAIVFRFITKENFRNVGWGLRRWWYVLPAFFVPLVITLGIVYIFETLNWATLSVFIFNNGMVDSIDRSIETTHKAPHFLP